MKRKLIILSISLLIFVSCSKKIEKSESSISVVKANTEADGYIKYTILKGRQYSDKSVFLPVKLSRLSFKVKFDSSAIYKTILESNQTDINKLLGFSDNNSDHHQYSARFGWRWSNNALRLFAYVYNEGVMNFKEMGTVKIGDEITCSIKVTGDRYLFTLNDTEMIMPRTSTTAVAEGYKLWPYFGGDEPAPQTISIWIKELPTE